MVCYLSERNFSFYLQHQSDVESEMSVNIGQAWMTVKIPVPLLCNYSRILLGARSPGFGGPSSTIETLNVISNFKEL